MLKVSTDLRFHMGNKTQQAQPLTSARGSTKKPVPCGPEVQKIGDKMSLIDFKKQLTFY